MRCGCGAKKSIAPDCGPSGRRNGAPKGSFSEIADRGQGFIIRKASRVHSALELNDAAICVEQGTTTELNFANYFRANRMRPKTVTFATPEEAAKAYETSRFVAFTTDASALYGARLKFAKPDDHVVLPEIISKEPLGPLVRHGDDQWFDIVKWVHFAMLDAGELNVNRANLEEQLRSDSPEVRRLLGAEGNFGEPLGLAKEWVYRAAPCRAACTRR
jgi:general L-amino acid transport system substrate-binding protein